MPEIEKRKKMEHRRAIHMCTGVEQIKTVRDAALKRKDELGKTVFTRLANAVDLVQTDARYHHDCYIDFMKLPSKKPVGRPVDIRREEAFRNVCQYMA